MLALLLAPSIASGESDPNFPSLFISKTGFGTGMVKCKFGGAGSFGPCTTPQPSGTLVEVKATADEGFFLTALSGDGSATGHCSGSTCSFTITESTEVTAVFNPPLSTLSITMAGTSSDRVECRFNEGPEEPCTSPRPTGTAVTVVASPDPSFAGFSDGTGSASGCSNVKSRTCSFTLEEDSSLTANFYTTPSFESESVSGITSTNAILEAQINPKERDIAYQFQLVADPSEYWSTFTCPPEPSDFFCRIIAPYLPWAEGALPIHFLEGETKTVSLNVEAKAGYTLLPGTTYHYRVIGAPHLFAEDSFEWEEPIIFGPDQTFTTPEEEPTGPTNLRTLTLKKSAGGTGGTGSVSSKPKGINCGAACTKAVAEMYENSTVVLKAKASTGTTIASWSGCATSTGVGGVEGTCEVTMSAAKEVKVAWSGTSKEILNAKPLTFSKGATEGKGTVKAYGSLACEAECSSTTVLYQGPVGAKAGKTVTLKETPAFGSEFSGWSGCESEPEGNCVVTMETAKSISAEFALKPTATLTLNKGGTGSGTVTSKPKAINCGATCTTRDATVPEGETIVLKAKASTGMTLSSWSGCKAETGVGTAEGTCTVSLSGASAVTASFSGTAKVIPEAKALTLTKAGSGYGTVKAAGLTCEVLCTSTASLYQGPPKAKVVTLVATSAPGSKTVAWSGCESEPVVEGKGTECVVTMKSAKAVTATFDELE